MRDAGSRRHSLHFPGADQSRATRTVLVPQRAFQYVSHDLHLAVRVRGESRAALDRVMIKDPQRPESHVVRVVVAVETEQPVRRQPIALKMESVFGSDDLHFSSSENVGQDAILSHIFSSFPGEFCELVNDSSENQPRRNEENEEKTEKTDASPFLRG